MKKLRSLSAFTLIELLVVISIIGILAALAVPSITGALVKGQMTGTMNNMRQIYLATQQMALEGSTTGDSSLCWPGDATSMSWSAFQTNMVPGYMGTNEFLKLLGAPGVVVPLGEFPNAIGQNALAVYSVKETDAGDTIFIATRNWKGFGTAGLTTSSPYGLKGFVLIRKGGDAAQYSSKQAGSPGATNGGFLGRTNGTVFSQ